MTRRVVAFMGGPRDAVAAFSRTLPNCLNALSASGVLVPKAGRSGNKSNGFTHQALAAVSSPGWAALQSEAKAAADAETVLLVIPSLLRIGRSESRRTAIMQRLASVADEVIVTSVVADQLTMINDSYLSQVASWRTGKRLEGLLPRLLENDVFVHEAVLQPWYGDPTAHYRAVPLPLFAARHPVDAVLEAADVELDRPLGAVHAAPLTKLGPIGVEAGRLLSTYLRAKIPRFDPSDPRVGPASRAALTRAEKLGWCAESFWGWSRRAADRTCAWFEASNNRFAQTVWGTDWMLPYPVERASNRVDFLDLDVQFVDQVMRYVVATANRVKREREN